ncbi:hypothetical protein Bbelb_373940 [Branchiostoma belcheri]|nr:hypothetical protein Bbelb_373940 [Branchiostoma belcheri]
MGIDIGWKWDVSAPKESSLMLRSIFETAPVRHVLGVDADRRHDAERAPYWTRPVPGQSPVLTRAACGRVPTGSYSSVGQLSGPWRVPGGIPTGSSRVFEQAGACSAARRVPGSEVTASLRRISPNGARSVFNSELKSIRRPRGAENRPAAVGKPAGLRSVPDSKSSITNDVAKFLPFHNEYRTPSPPLPITWPNSFHSTVPDSNTGLQVLHYQLRGQIPSIPQLLTIPDSKSSITNDVSKFHITVTNSVHCQYEPSHIPKRKAVAWLLRDQEASRNWGLRRQGLRSLWRRLRRGRRRAGDWGCSRGPWAKWVRIDVDAGPSLRRRVLVPNV